MVGRSTNQDSGSGFRTVPKMKLRTATTAILEVSHEVQTGLSSKTTIKETAIPDLTSSLFNPNKSPLHPLLPSHPIHFPSPASSLLPAAAMGDDGGHRRRQRVCRRPHFPFSNFTVEVTLFQPTCLSLTSILTAYGGDGGESGDATVPEKG